MARIETRWAQAALTAHDIAAMLPKDQSANLQVWHILISLLVFCRETGVDFERELEDAKHHLLVEGTRYP